MDEFKRFLDSLVYWLSTHHGVEATYKVNSAAADVSLTEDGEEFYIGGYADSGMQVIWLGPHKLADKEESLVRVNGIVMSAIGKHVAGWAVGLS